MSILSRLLFISGVFLCTSANADFLGALKQVNEGLSAVNLAIGGQSSNGENSRNFALAGMPSMATPSGSDQVAQVVIPSDKRVRSAIDEAMPTIKTVLGIHQCVRTQDSLRPLNIHALPGVDMTKADSRYSFPNMPYNAIGIGSGMKYHDTNKCVDIRAIDKFAMPALNALNFRVVYFANDSGETVNFNYSFRKVDDGTWKLAGFCSRYGC